MNWRGIILQEIARQGRGHQELAELIESKHGFGRSATFRWLRGEGRTSSDRLEALAVELGLELQPSETSPRRRHLAMGRL